MSRVQSKVAYTKKPMAILTALVMVGAVLMLVPGAHAQAATVDSAVTVDGDGDGYIDAVKLTFSEPIDDSTIDPTDFTIETGEAPYDNNALDVITGGRSSTVNSRISYAPNTANDAVIFVVIAEESLDGDTDGDTDETPDVTYTAGDLTDDDGDSIGTTTPTTDDKAGPVVLSVDAAAGDPDEIVVTLSEGAAKVSDDTALTAADFTYVGGSSGAQSIGSVDHTVDTATATLTLDTNVAKADICRDTVALKTSADDGAPGNPAKTTAVELRSLDTPCIMSARGNPGSADVTLTFTEGVDGSGTGDKLVLPDLTFAGGSTGATSMLSITHTGGASTATLTLNAPLTVGDLGSDTVALKSNVHDGTSTNTASTAPEPILDRTRPTITARETVDANDNGLIDGIRVIFSEPIDDPTFSSVRTHFTLEAPYGDGDNHPTSITTAGTADDDTILLVFGEEGTPGTDFDTGETPTVAYSGTVLADLAGNTVMPAGAMAATDKAKPVLDSAATGDTEPNGRIDLIELVFSEPIDDSTFDTSDWSLGSTYNPVTGFDTGMTVDDATIAILFAEKSVIGDTGATPDVTYTAPSEDGVTDLDGNTLSGFTATPDDGAAPILLSAHADRGSGTDLDEVVATFSEGVDNGAGVALEKVHFGYDNDNTGGASAFRSGDAVDHVAGEATVRFHLNGELVSGDYSGTTPDKIHAAADSVFDAASNAAPETPPLAITEGAPTVVSLTTGDSDGDGLIQAIVIEFSEPLDDLTHFPPDAWDVRIPDADEDPPDTNSDDTVYEVTSVDTGTTPDDKFLVLRLSERDDVDSDTDAAPLVDYTKPGDEDLQIVDADGVTLESFTDKDSDDGAPPLVTGAVTGDADTDGEIDRYVVTFTEDVDELTFTASEWKVGNAVVTGLVSDGDPEDASITIEFPEGSNVGTGATPQLTYTASATFRDVNGNGLASFGDAKVTETDGAGPVLLSAVGEVGEASMTLTFSEGVFGSALGDSLTVGGDGSGEDVEYDDVSHSGTPRTAQSISHTAGEATATVTMSKSWNTVNDFGADTITPAVTTPATIVDANGNGLAGNEVKLTQGSSGDVTPPGKVPDLAVVADSESSTGLQLTWTAPGEDGAGGGTVSSYIIKRSTSTITEDNFDSATTTSATFTPDLASPDDTQVATLSGLDPGTDYFFAVKAVDEADNRGVISDIVTASTEEEDTTAPADVDDLAVVSGSVTANSVRIEWTAPGDDGTDGTVASYTIKVSTSDITDETTFDAADDATVTFQDEDGTENPTLKAAGETQHALITGLELETEYFIALRAQDEVPNLSGVSDSVSVTTLGDTTAPTGTLTVTSSTHTEDVESENDNPAFSWSGLSDPQSTITYYYALNQQSGYTIDGTESGSTTGTSVSGQFANTPEGTWYFHVNGQSAGGFNSGAQATFTIIIVDTDTGQPDADGDGVPDADDDCPGTPAGADVDTHGCEIDDTTITQQQIGDNNDDIQSTVQVSRSGGDNTVTWTVPSGLTPPPEGVQIWRATSPFSLLATIDADDADYQASSYTDEDAPSSSRYVVTLFYGSTEALGQYSGDLENVPGYDDKSDAQFSALGASPQQDGGGGGSEDDGIPTWAWILIVAGAVLIVVLIIVLIAVGRRKEEDPYEEDDADWQTAPAYAWRDEPGQDTGYEDEPAPEEGGEEHTMRCPKCDNTFTAHGTKPIRTECPNCGQSGVLN